MSLKDKTPVTETVLMSAFDTRDYLSEDCVEALAEAAENAPPLTESQERTVRSSLKVHKAAAQLPRAS